jgi:peptidoglycan/LPS O-acetylase OafA/YrhL
VEAKSRLEALTGLRLVAAAVVAVAHMPFLHADPRLAPAVRRAMAEGSCGLTIFFVLSGFVLTYGYHDRLANPTRREVGRYYLARVARIWPVHLLALVAVLFVPIPGATTGTGPLLANVFLVHTWVPDITYAASYNSVSWTLSLEAFFYLALPIMLIVTARYPLRPRWLLFWAAVAWLIPAALTLALSGGGTSGAYICVFCPLVRVGEFIIGVNLGLMYVRGAPPTGGRRLWTAREVFAVGSLVGLLAVCDRVPPLFRMNGYYTPAAALLIHVFARQRGALSRLLASRPAVYLGEVSFSFYMLHAAGFAVLSRQLGGACDPFAQAAIQVAVVVAVAALVHHTFEMPMRTAILRIGRARPAEPEPRRAGRLARLFARFRAGPPSRTT